MLAVEDERSDVEVLTDYFTELYKSEDGLERPARNLLANFYKHQGMDSEELDINNLSEASQSNSEEIASIIIHINCIPNTWITLSCRALID
ncbi:hypothetical protein HRED_10077 [Candidatus Haloredivivus sp. G17]|nr:hypothetical protein HRED_10077 [Candidatus Haloredivivus sp. G17]